MNQAAIIHRPTSDYIYPSSRNTLELQLITARGDADEAELWYWMRYETDPAKIRRQRLHAHQLLAQFLIVQRMGNLAATALAGVIAVDGFLAQRRRQLFQRTGFLSTQKDGTVHVADNRIRAVFIQGFKLALCLQDKAAGDFSGTDRRNQLFKSRYLADIRGLVDQAADMNRQATAVHIICLFAKQISCSKRG